MTKISGNCLCGAVSYEGDGEPIFAGNCHCTDCRKLSASGHMSLMAWPEAGVSIKGDVTAHTVTADSGATVTNHFCPKCGSQIFKTNSNMPGVRVLVAGTLDDPEIYKPAVSVYASRALSWDRPDPATQQFETMPPTGG